MSVDKIYFDKMTCSQKISVIEIVSSAKKNYNIVMSLKRFGIIS
jgi:hypothetical protein